MEKLKTFVNTSKNINQVVQDEFTMDCKVICGFDFSLVNVSLFFVFLLSESRIQRNCGRIALV